MAAADQITAAGQASFPDSFGGVEFNAAGKGLIVHLVSPTASIEAALLKKASVPRQVVTFAPASRTYSSTTDLNQRVSSQFGALQAAGIDIRSSGIGPGGKEVIGVRGLTPSINVFLHSEFGNDVVVTEAGPEGIFAVEMSTNVTRTGAEPTIPGIRSETTRVPKPIASLW